MSYASWAFQVKSDPEAGEMFKMWHSRWLFNSGFVCFFLPGEVVREEKEKKMWTPFQITIKTDPAFAEEPASTLLLSAPPRSVLDCPVELKPELMWRLNVLQSRTCSLSAAPWWGASDRNLQRLNLHPLNTRFKERGLACNKSTFWDGNSDVTDFAWIPVGCGFVFGSGLQIGEH